MGPSGIEVPQVELDETVDEAVAAFYYPQQGIRSWGGAPRVNSAGKERLEYAEWWNTNGILWMQIESIEAVTHARHLAKPGVDCLSFGPADLTFSMEGHPNHALQTVDACVEYVARALEGTTTAVCFRNGNPSTRQKYADMGVTVFFGIVFSFQLSVISFQLKKFVKCSKVFSSFKVRKVERGNW